MTTSTKDIEALVDQYCSSVHFTELDRLLEKLDHEDLDVLRAMLKDSYKSGKFDEDERSYKKGWTSGYNYGH